MGLRFKTKEKPRGLPNSESRSLSKRLNPKAGKTKPKKEKPVLPPPKALSDLGLQNFKMERVHRDQLKAAPYNPRVISDGAKARLKAGMKRHGVVEPLVWNKRTGNLVGGHQRIGVLDSLAETHNYELDVAVIDVDEGREKELNLLLNNPEAQGDWELDKLAEMFKDQTMQITGTGFDTADVYRLFGDSPMLEHEADLEQYAQRVDKAREGFEAAKRMVFERDTNWFYLVVIFQDIYDMDDFLDKKNLPGGRWQSGADFRRICNLEPYEPPEQIKKPSKAKQKGNLEQALKPSDQSIVNTEKPDLSGNGKERKHLRFSKTPTPAI